MSLISLSIEHGQSCDQARARLEQAVAETTQRFGPLVRRVEWSADRNRVKIFGPGVQLELWVDAASVHVTGDIPILAQLAGGKLLAGLKGILQRTFAGQLSGPANKST